MRAIALPRARAYAVSSDLPPVRGRGPQRTRRRAVAGPFVGLFLQQGNAGSVSRFEWHGTVLETREHLEVSPCLRDQSEKTSRPWLASSRLARRRTTVPKSISWKSTLITARRR